ncbi:hypothetical protein JW960_23825 [candidate division KSB1 bacterium]|nr:hypothetical protein [candidate division KSB1 bacterium]
MKFSDRVKIEKRICDLILMIGLIFTYLLLAGIRVSPGKYLFRAPQKEIDWTIFHIEETTPKKTGHSRLPQPDDKITRYRDNAIIIPSIESLDADITSKLDLPRKTYQALAVPQTERVDRQMQFARHQQPKNQVNVSMQQAEYASLHDVPFPEAGQVPQIIVDLPDDTPLDLQAFRFVAPTQFNKLEVDKAIPDAEIIKIELRPDDIKENEKDLSPIIHELIQWMQSNPVVFSSVFKRFLNYEPGNLTSHTRFEINSKVYELFLLCKINILEIRICLIERNNLTLLIDSGLKEKSNYLRLGSIKRAADGTISSFISQQKTPTPEVTEDFYKIFLSWWTTAKTKTMR